MWTRVMLAWSLAASGIDPDTAARVLVEVITATPEPQLSDGRQVLLVAALETCARSMAAERATLLDWLTVFIRVGDFEFAQVHERQVLERTMQVVVARLRANLVSTNFTRHAEVNALPPKELLKLRDRVRVHNPKLEPRPPRLLRHLPSTVDEVFEHVFFALLFVAGVFAVAGIAWALFQALGLWGLAAALASVVVYVVKRRSQW